jgi:hypothetical protein
MQQQEIIKDCAKDRAQKEKYLKLYAYQARRNTEH